jgi:predicted XRE-type DNA-binding protein
MTERKTKLMNAEKRKRLEARGWKIGTVKEFLGLSDEEELLIAIRIALSRALAEKRKQRAYSQEKLASLLGSSQSRVAKMEAGDRSVSIDLLVRALLSLGSHIGELSRIVGKAERVRRQLQHA